MTLTLTLSLLLATPNFPAKVAAASGGPTPDCALCHAGGVTGRGTVTTPFGAAMRQRGLVAHDVASFDAAWATLGGVDSDSDGVPDAQELADGSNPNGGGDSIVPQYGCAQISSEPLLVLLAVAFRGARGRRRDPARARSGAEPSEPRR